MITLDQVQKLERKVNDAVDLINRLKAEKVMLEEKVLEYEMRILELEEMADKLNKDQNEIEDKIIGALNRLGRQRKDASMRMITDPATGDRFVWDAYTGPLHAHVAEQIGIPVD